MASSPRLNAPEQEQQVLEGSSPTNRFANRRNFEQRPKLSIPLLLFNDADTLLYIDPVPESQPRTIALPPTIPHRVHSEKLLGTGSTFFARLFKPRYQAKIRKERGYVDKLPDGIKYLVDLTPAMLDEDAVIALTEISCPKAIRTWATYKHRWKLPDACVGGEDEQEFVEFREPFMVHDEHEEEEDDPEYPQEEEQEERNGDPCSPWHQYAEPTTIVRAGLPVEYSAARHREGIEHVLHVLEGLDITLDTPCKLWTFFAVAKIYDVATVSIISGYIIAWFYEKNNTRFIEIHPEIAYRVACGIRSMELCRDAFVGLVSDEALLYLIRSAGLEPLKEWKTSFTNSPMKDVLDDTEVQRIEYASKAFTDDIIKHFLHLAGEEMTWLADIPEFKKITEHASDHPEDHEVVSTLTACLKDNIRNAIYQVLCKGGDPVRSCDTVPLDQQKPYCRAFTQHDMLLRLMGQKFWAKLMTCGRWLSESDSRGPYRSVVHSTIADIGYGLLAFKGQENASVCGFLMATLLSSVQDFNDLVKHRAKEELLRMESEERSKASNEEWHGKLTINLRPGLRLDDESLFFPMETTLPERPANSRQFTPFDPFPPFQNLSNNPSSIADTPNADKIDEIQPSIPQNFLAFDLEVFHASVTAYISEYSRSLIYKYERPPFSTDNTGLLICLSDNEWQYLPLWAGGNDDGTGGVFTDHEIPMMNTGGFSAPGPAVHTGSTASTDDSFSEINPSDSQSTVLGASRHATYSHTSDVMSMHSFDEVEIPMEYSTYGKQPPVTGVVDHDLDNLDISSATSDGEDEFDVESTGASTVVMGSPHLSGFSDDDLDMVDLDEDFDLLDEDTK